VPLIPPEGTVTGTTSHRGIKSRAPKNDRAAEIVGGADNSAIHILVVIVF